MTLTLSEKITITKRVSYKIWADNIFVSDVMVAIAKMYYLMVDDKKIEIFLSDLIKNKILSMESSAIMDYIFLDDLIQEFLTESSMDLHR